MVKHKIDINIGAWTSEEHGKFLDAIKKYGNKWREVKRYVGTRSGTQVRSHAQKYLLQLKRIEKDKQSVAKSEIINYTKEITKKKDMVVDYWKLETFDHKKYHSVYSKKLWSS